MLGNGDISRFSLNVCEQAENLPTTYWQLQSGVPCRPLLSLLHTPSATSLSSAYSMMRHEPYRGLSYCSRFTNSTRFQVGRVCGVDTPATFSPYPTTALIARVSRLWLKMLILIIGTRCAGKATIRNYLATEKEFTILELEPDQSDIFAPSTSKHNALAHLPQSPLDEDQTGSNDSSSPSQAGRTLRMRNRTVMLDYVTRNWKTNFVTNCLDGTRPEALLEFVRRPFCAVLHVDAPINLRWQRAQQKAREHLVDLPRLEDFIVQHDELVFGSALDVDVVDALPTALASSTDEMPAPVPPVVLPSAPLSPSPAHALRPITRPSMIATAHLVTLRISNRYASKAALYAHLDTLDIVRPDRLRPTWDDYFMTLAELAARRANCMKRRVGAILVRQHRIVATG